MKPGGRIAVVKDSDSGEPKGMKQKRKQTQNQRGGIHHDEQLD
jgi:hypothetical protein